MSKDFRGGMQMECRIVNTISGASKRIIGSNKLNLQFVLSVHCKPLLTLLHE